MAKQYSLSSPFFYDQMMADPANTIRIMRFNQDSSGNNAGEPIEVIRGIYRDDFTFGVQNQWQSGGSSILKMIVDTVGDMITGRDAKFVTTMMTKSLDIIEAGNKGENNWITQNMGTARDFVNSATDLANSHIFSADDYFKSFKGSSVTVPTSVSLSLLSDDNSYDIFTDMSNLLNISVGKFETMAAGFVGVQAAPNGFKSDFLSLEEGKIIPGSIKIIYGDPKKGGFEVSNMIVSNISFSFSKAKVIVNGKYRPLMIDIQMAVEPARMFSRNDLDTMLGLR